MASLLETQQAFAKALLFDDIAPAAMLVLDNGIPASERLSIYRNNARLAFLAALQASFPVIQQLGGEEWFSQTARHYQQRHPSPSGDLQHVGELFAEYLAGELRDSSYDYFSDVARLEWAYQQSLVAAEHPAERFNIERLSQVPPDGYATLQFHLHSTARLVASRYPIFTLWQAHQTKAQTETKNEQLKDEQLSVDIDAGPQQVLILRRESHVELRLLTLGEYLLLDAFLRQANLQDALSLAMEADDTLDVATVLQRFAKLGVLCGFSQSFTN